MTMKANKQDKLYRAVGWLLLGMAACIAGAACTQSSSATGASIRGATTEQAHRLMAEALPEAKRRLNTARGVWEHGANRMLAVIDSVEIDALCFKHDPDTTYGWADYPDLKIHFCNMPLARLENAAGWWLHELSHAALDTKDYAYGRAESLALPLEKQLKNGASWGMLGS